MILPGRRGLIVDHAVEQQEVRKEKLPLHPGQRILKAAGASQESSPCARALRSAGNNRSAPGLPRRRRRSSSSKTSSMDGSPAPQSSLAQATRLPLTAPRGEAFFAWKLSLFWRYAGDDVRAKQFDESKCNPITDAWLCVRFWNSERLSFLATFC